MKRTLVAQIMFGVLILSAQALWIHAGSKLLAAGCAVAAIGYLCWYAFGPEAHR